MAFLVEPNMLKLSHKNTSCHLNANTCKFRVKITADKILAQYCRRLVESVDNTTYELCVVNILKSQPCLQEIYKGLLLEYRRLILYCVIT